MSSNQSVLFLKKENEELKWFKVGDEKTGDGKYIGEIENELPNGQGTYNWLYGKKYVGEWKDGEKWNITSYDRYGNVLSKWINGE